MERKKTGIVHMLLLEKEGALLQRRQMMAYQDKERFLEQYFEEVSPSEFYRDVFPEGSFEKKGCQGQGKANGIFCKVFKGGRSYHTIITDSHEELLSAIENQEDDESMILVSPIAYYGSRRNNRNASLMYALVIDLDYVEEEQIYNFFDLINHEVLPRPTYVANSGHGLHVYFVFDTPIRLYKSQCCAIKSWRDDITSILWNPRTVEGYRKEKVQYQGIVQAMRCVGSYSKIGTVRIKAYRTGDKVSVEYLNGFLEMNGRKPLSLIYKSKMTLDEAKEMYPEWYERKIVEEKSFLKPWIIKRALYDWYFRELHKPEHIWQGHRYFCIGVLATYARKCGFYDAVKNPNPVTEEELRRDAYSLLEQFNRCNGQTEEFTADDLEHALHFYQEDYITFPRDHCEKVSGFEFPRNKRNWRKQEKHLAGARAIRDINNDNWREGNGRPDKKRQVQAWRKEHPDGSKADCIRTTGLSKPTVLKWWETDDLT